MAFPSSPAEGEIYKRYRYTSGHWKDVAIVPQGLYKSYPATLSKGMIPSVYPSGLYWIKGARDSVASQWYCENAINGGGWMLFASAPSTGYWGNVDSGTGASWAGLSYSYGTYPNTYVIGDYWKNYCNHDITEIMFLTGDKVLWVSFPIAYIKKSGDTVDSGALVFSEFVKTSNNFPIDAHYYNDYVTVLHRSSQLEDPWINVGNTHAGGEDYMFWGETGCGNHYSFKNLHGGIFAFVR